MFSVMCIWDITIVTGETVDTYRSYDLFEQIPDLNSRLSDCRNRLIHEADNIEQITGRLWGQLRIGNPQYGSSP